MNANDQLGELLLKWERQRESGDELSAEELCEGDEHLAERLNRYIVAMKGTDWLFEDDGDEIQQTAEQSAGETETIPPSLTAAEFARSLSDSGLFTSDEVQQFQASNAKEDAASLANRLIADGKLTRYQAQVLLQRNSDPLFIDKYLILDAVGSGGMGVVFKALQKSMDRVVALKVLPKSAVDSADKIQRFQREARAAAKLSHPNIATAHDADNWNGIHFLVMEYVAGCNLADHVEQHGPMATSQAVDYTLQAARGLVHAHERRIIHRDIKPANLILGNDGVVKVVDMGLAAFERNSEDATQYSTMAGTVMGTAAYMSPEQAADTTDADDRSDIYSLGATLYFLLTGRPPYQGPTSMKTMLAHRDAPIPSLRAARPDVPVELDQIYQRMIAKDPACRFQSTRELVAALETLGSARAGEIQPKPPKLAPKQPATASSRQTGVLVGGLFLALVLAVASAAVFYIATDSGELIVFCNEPGIEVLIKRHDDVVKDMRLLQGETRTTIRSGHYLIELRGVNADRFVLDREGVTISRGDRKVVTVTQRRKNGGALESVKLPLISRFNDEDGAARHWVWNDGFTFSSSGAKAPKGSASHLRSRHRFTGDVRFDLEFSLGNSQYANTGAAWIVVWNKRIPIAKTSGRVDTWIHIHREANEIIFTQNDETRRIPIEPSEASKATGISIFWRSRSSHFRSIEIKGGVVDSARTNPENSFAFTDRAHTDKHWSWNDDMTFANDGGMTPRGAGSFLRSRRRYSSSTAFEMDFSLGEASFNNTGGASITVWNKRLSIAENSKPIDLKIHIHIDNDEIVFRRNNDEQRISIDTADLSAPTFIDFRWRSRTAHFRHIEIKAASKEPAD